jgi:hypothetical protein
VLGADDHAGQPVADGKRTPVANGTRGRLRKVEAVLEPCRDVSNTQGSALHRAGARHRRRLEVCAPHTPLARSRSVHTHHQPAIHPDLQGPTRKRSRSRARGEVSRAPSLGCHAGCAVDPSNPCCALIKTRFPTQPQPADVYDPSTRQRHFVLVPHGPRRTSTTMEAVRRALP